MEQPPEGAEEVVAQYWPIAEDEQPFFVRLLTEAESKLPQYSTPVYQKSEADFLREEQLKAEAEQRRQEEIAAEQADEVCRQKQAYEDKLRRRAAAEQTERIWDLWRNNTQTIV